MFIVNTLEVLRVVSVEEFNSDEETVVPDELISIETGVVAVGAVGDVFDVL